MAGKGLADIKKMNRRHAEAAINNIKVGRLVQRLQDFAMALTDDEGKLIDQTKMMTSDQIKAAGKLLDKALPNRTKEETEVTVSHSYEISNDVLNSIKALAQGKSEKLEKDITKQCVVVDSTPE